MEPTPYYVDGTYSFQCYLSNIWNTKEPCC